MRRYAGLIYIILAIVAESHPSELDAVLIQLEVSGTVNHTYVSAEEVGQAALQAAKAWLVEATREPEARKWPIEVFQTCFLITKYNKFTGRWPEYRDGLACDVGRLQRAKLHRLSSGVLGDNAESSDETCTRYRTFWHYFALERWVEGEDDHGLF